MDVAVKDVSEQTFADEVIRASADGPVVVDFWAAWCGPCRTLGPLLERLAAEADGAWTLAKVDVDANPGLAAQFGVQGIPAVHAFRDGREVARFVGALPEPQVRAWLEQLGPTPADLAVADARAAEDRGDTAAALAAYRLAVSHEPARAEARAAIARLELAERAATIDEDALGDADPTDVDASLALADLAFARGDVGGAADRLVAVVRATAGDERERARAHLVSLLETLPADDDRANAARRALAGALF